ncbi:MAG: phosphoribosylformylglycinamidine synthase I [Pelotomaculum sp.]|uniref:Phosphoribosylformylglycinamidine synthase subunit PurQ n=1 Tax=Pelotomaculum thermopropionicum (strain DSM 13744 / JCM 10971 / SI) TaxID=370438 RepID=A5D2D2_PELTS|nr:phosphoribosylformylglycinamidine synthase I [Pelotomaculum sp.]BAF59611.1 phosphoribosylformylglycinamidine (FGAM) synthase, glutamine amidotransferase domain [Pelotomaculum thermopropionicum SI]
MKKPRVCIMKTDGINCDEETYYAFVKAGAECRIVHVNQLRKGEEKLASYQILALPGGFSYGDDVHSGKILAVELTSFLKDQLKEFVNAGKLIIGICNGFQVLVRTGLLPEQNLDCIKTTLMVNDSGHFECRWVNLLVEHNHCVFTKGLEGTVISVQVAHGEGKFYTDPATLQEIENRGQVVFRYAGTDGRPTVLYPYNPNGSLNAIAGICDSTGRIMGMMPHPERYVEKTQHPNWRRLPGNTLPHGMAIFKNAVEYALQL